MLNSVLADQVPVCQAAEVLGVSEHHMRRILAAYRKEGAAVLAHGNRGRRPAVVQLPGKERPSYAGAQLEIHEGLDGQLLVQYQGRTIPTQEAPALELSVPPMVLSDMAPALTASSHTGACRATWTASSC